ncbi:MAG: 50S ribosomal protein L22 [Symbiobacteriaceae bacterium]|nr:50S ribosomal protein L22 [Symbiobacteriaceae bacterium]
MFDEYVPLESRAVARHQRIAPRKVRIVIDHIRGLAVEDALTILKFTPKAAAPIITKVVKSAMANAVNNFEMDEGVLYIAEAFVDAGPTMKRMRPRQRGRAFPIAKRSSHITIVLRER